MAGYFIARVSVTDREKYGAYQALALKAIEQYGGEIVIRGGEVTTMEGPEETRRVVTLRFDTVEQAKAFYNSPEYQAAKAERDGAADFSAIVVEGD